MTNPVITYDDKVMDLVFSGLPELVGTDKQVAWAESLRLAAIQNVKRQFHNTRAGAISQGRLAQYLVEMPALVNERVAPKLANADAKFWIDNKGIDLARG